VRITSIVLGKIIMKKLNVSLHRTFEKQNSDCFCAICHRYCSKTHTELLFMDGNEEVRVCYLCNHA